MAKDHIIPQAYIRQFATPEKQQLYFFSRNQWNKKVEIGTPGKICYGHEYYYLSSNTSARYNVAASHLDKELLKKYEDAMPKMFDGLFNGKAEIFLKNAEFIAEFIVTLKMRSGFFRTRIYNGNNVTNALNKVIDELITYYPSSSSEILQTKKLMEQQLTNEKSAGYLHSTSLLRLLKGERDPLFKKLRDRILQHQWRIINACNGVEFISSDNPGFFLNKDDEITNTNFEGDGLFTFPLTPTKALQIDFSSPDLPAVTHKNVGNEVLDGGIILHINKATYSLCEKTVYGLSKQQLEAAIS